MAGLVDEVPTESRRVHGFFFSDFRLTLKMRGDSSRKCSSLVLQANTVDNPNLALTGTTIDNCEQFLFPFRSFPYTFILDNSNHVLSA